MKYEIFNVIVGTPFDKVPALISGWAAVNPALMPVSDINKDGILQLDEIRIGADITVLATPEITGYYMALTQPWLRKVFEVTTPMKDAIWWDIQPIAAGVFGNPLGFVVLIIVSLRTKAPEKDVQDLVEHARYPNLAMA